MRDPLSIVNAASPAPAAGVLERGPQPGVGGDARVRQQVGMRRARGKLGIGKSDLNGTFELPRVDAQADHIAIAQAADRTAGPSLRTDVADAGAGGYSGKTAVGNERDALPVLHVLERGSDRIVRPRTPMWDAEDQGVGAQKILGDRLAGPPYSKAFGPDRVPLPDELPHFRPRYPVGDQRPIP